MNSPAAYPANHKFRPYFTISEIQEVIRCLKISCHSPELLRYMETFAVQIERGTRVPGLTVAPTIEQRLGVSQTDLDYRKGKSQYSIHELYQIWCNDPTLLAPAQISQVHQYRWESDLMTVEESALYESKILSVSPSASAPTSSTST